MHSGSCVFSSLLLRWREFHTHTHTKKQAVEKKGQHQRQCTHVLNRKNKPIQSEKKENYENRKKLMRSTRKKLLFYAFYVYDCKPIQTVEHWTTAIGHLEVYTITRHFK